MTLKTNYSKEDLEKKSRKDKKKTAPVRKAKGAEVNYREDLLKLNDNFLKDFNSSIIEMIKNNSPFDEINNFIESNQEIIQRSYDIASYEVVGKFIEKAEVDNKKRLQKSLKESLGVDYATVLDDEPTKNLINFTFKKNTSLIKSIPSEHFGKVQQALFESFTKKDSDIVSRLVEIGDISEKRAIFIARDQNNKFTSDLNKFRQENVGIKEYIWRTASDSAVTGNPSNINKPSKGHGNHYLREGKKFKYSDPPPDGHAGFAFNCRCYAEPIIDIEDLNLL